MHVELCIPKIHIHSQNAVLSEAISALVLPKLGGKAVGRSHGELRNQVLDKIPAVDVGVISILRRDDARPYQAGIPLPKAAFETIVRSCRRDVAERPLVYVAHEGCLLLPVFQGILVGT